ncbi:hypothetical protein [Pontiella desulfatans]|uniref:hypothetical protein n=1 Tax=Pontiella desulfatans TaxID=2750659 RepID=UPI00109D3F64|nr:hypothetical protein [Pontiella desulfatans]
MQKITSGFGGAVVARSAGQAGRLRYSKWRVSVRWYFPDGGQKAPAPLEPPIDPVHQVIRAEHD